jgi:Ca2+-binding RTX toxin-like protein
MAVVNMLKLNNASDIQVDQVSNILALGAGRITVVGDSPTVVIGDSFSQTIGGGNGSDVLGGGGGTDLLIGGAGQDTFLLGAAGHVTISDFAQGDVMKFNVLNVKSVGQLAAKITRATEDSAGITITVGTDLTVTLTGLRLNTNFTEAMFAFGS